MKKKGKKLNRRKIQILGENMKKKEGKVDFATRLLLRTMQPIAVQ